MAGFCLEVYRTCNDSVCSHTYRHSLRSCLGPVAWDYSTLPQTVVIYMH
jgi:hypothetical protein